MDIRFKCHSCGQSFVVDDSAVGHVYSCTCCSAAVAVPFAVPPVIPLALPVVVTAPVKRWAINVGWICFSAGAVAMLIPLVPTFFIYLPLFLASVVLGVIGLVQKRVAAGIGLLAANIIGVPIIFVISLVLGLATWVGSSGTMAKQASFKFVVPPAATVPNGASTNYSTIIAVADSVHTEGERAGASPPNALQRIKTLRFSVDRDQHHTEISTPSVSDIQRAVLAVDQNKDESYIILEQKEGTCLETVGDLQGGYILEYQDDDIKRDGTAHFRAQRSYSAAELANVLISYARGTADWRNSATWELKKL